MSTEPRAFQPKLRLATREDYLAQLTDLVNQVINADYQMQPLITITPETPGVVGDVVDNFTRLNDDLGDIADEVSRLEDNASVLYNLAASGCSERSSPADTWKT